MARVFQTYKTRTDPKTGKRIDLLNGRGQKIPHPRWRYQIIDRQGRRRIKTGYPTKTETIKLAHRVQAQEDEIRNGYRPAPRSAEKHATRPFSEAVDEYMTWGESQGGRGGRGWSKVHRRMRRSYLAWWEERLGIEVLADLIGILPRIEKALRELQKTGRAGKTLNNYREALSSFSRWAISRGYLSENPLQGSESFDSTPRTQRRAMTIDEIHRLLLVAPPDRELIYEVALTTGCRANELKQLKVGDLSIDLKALCLRPETTKNRKPAIQPLPQALLDRLVDSTRRKEPDEPLLKVPSHPARELNKDLKAARIPKYVVGQGKLDFHALRVTHITLVIEVGANVKEAQTLARHSDPRLTMNIYARASNKRLAEITEAVGDILPFDATQPAHNGKQQV